MRSARPTELGERPPQPFVCKIDGLGHVAAIREQHNELRAIHEAALGKLRGISYALYIILGIILCILAGLGGPIDRRRPAASMAL